MGKTLSEAVRAQIVQLHQGGMAQRAIARQLQVTLDTVQRWVRRAAAGEKLEDRSCAPRRQARQISAHVEAQICQLRTSLAAQSALGFIGAQAIADALARQYPPAEVPALRTIARVLARHGLLDGAKRIRRLAPPTGWHLPGVAAGQAEADAFDIIEDLPIEGVGLCHTLTTKSLVGPVVQAWMHARITTRAVLDCLHAHWSLHGLPTYAQFDNDTRFQGPHNRPNVIGEVIRFCLRLGVTPVFAPPRETGFQADIEGFNALWQAKVWHRARHPSFPALQLLSDKFCSAYLTYRSTRSEHVPLRRPFPALSMTAPIVAGVIIFIRRTNDLGQVRILEQPYLVDPAWSHRLVRTELHIASLSLSFYRLRRKDPLDQPLVHSTPLLGTLRLS